MAAPQLPDPVKLFIAILWGDHDALAQTLHHLRDLWGELDFTGRDQLFDCTHYYDEEMGAPLWRRLIAFELLVPPENLPRAKLTCNALEDGLAHERRRKVNLDVGYLDHNKIVLASCKNAGQKIYLGEGIYADLVGRWQQGRYQPFAWTFPDFREGRYDAELNVIRQTYLSQLRARRQER